MGAVIDDAKGTAGKRTVTVTAKDAQGGSSSAAQVFEGTNQGPTLNVAKPAVDATIFRGQTVKFDGSPTDPNRFAGVACSAITWKVAKANVTEQTQTGCQPAFTFTTNGTRELSVTATDEAGASATRVRNFAVVDPPLNAPPFVTILQPADNTLLSPAATITLKATATDPDDGSTVTGSWFLKIGGGSEIALGSGNQISWKPSDNVPFTCGNEAITLIFRAADGDGTSTDQVSASVNFGPC